MSETLIRAGSAADAATCREIERSTSAQFRDSVHPEVDDMETRPASAFHGPAAAGALLVAEREGAVIGFALMIHEGDVAHIEELDVAREFQGQGVGSMLLDAATSWGRERGARRLTLTTFRHVPWNEPYYRRRGFEELPPDDPPPVVRSETERYAADGWGPEARLAMVRPID